MGETAEDEKMRVRMQLRRRSMAQATARRRRWRGSVVGSPPVVGAKVVGTVSFFREEACEWWALKRSKSPNYQSSV
jgi:hypothetical protein